MARKRARGSASPYTILVVDDQEETLKSVRRLLESEGHRILTAASGADALALLGAEKVHVALVDYLMPRMSGEVLVARIREIDPTIQIVLQTGYAGERPALEMLDRLDIHGYHDKAEGPEKLLVWVNVALKAYDQIERCTQAERLKSEMLANVSHELRTPVHVIVGYTEMMLDGGCGPLAPDAIETIERVRGNAARLRELIDEFLDMSRLEAGAVGVQLRPVAVDSFRPDFEREAARLLDGKPVSFRWAADGVPRVLADPGKLRVALFNLLHNAAKFTRSGEIRVDGSDEPETVRIAVSDTGIGIDPGDHEAIFEAFRQTNAPESAGTGLGLTIARRLVRLMGGDVTVESAPGAGATFAIRLRRAPTRPETGVDPEQSAA